MKHEAPVNKRDAEARLQGNKVAANRLERRIMRDLLICTLLTVLFSSASYFFSLRDAVAQWTGRPEIREVDGFVPVLIYAVWLIGIFILRRLHDLRSAMGNSSAIEEQLSRARTVGAVERMAAGVAHDFNNMLVVISGSMQLAEIDDDCPESVKKVLSPAGDAVEQASRLANQLMRVGRHKPEPASDLDLNEVVSDMMQVLKYLASSEDVVLETVLNPEECRIVAGQGHVEQVILNLVANACEAADVDRKVVIETRRITADKQIREDGHKIASCDCIELKVVDSGSGIDPQIIKKIFEPYFTTKKTGTGLGLATVRSIVKKSRGSLDVTSMPGEGTIFAVYWPVSA